MPTMFCDSSSRSRWTSSSRRLPPRPRTGCLRESGLSLADIDVIIAAPARSGYRAALAELLGVPVERVIVAGDERLHTAALVAAFGNGLCRRVPVR